MLSSKFVLCPSGDLKSNGVAWTYRFFEGAICGAIPVIEDFCPAYEGYRVRSTKEPLGPIAWSRADADHNFEPARGWLVPGPDALSGEGLGPMCRTQYAPVRPSGGRMADESG